MRLDDIGTARDLRPLFVHGTKSATKETILAELRARFPHRREERDRIYQNGIIIEMPGGLTVGVGTIDRAAALDAGDGIGYVRLDISDIGRIG